MTTRLVPDNSTCEDGVNALATAMGQDTALILRLAHATGHNPRA